MNQEPSNFDAGESFKKALEAHRSGNLDSAEAIYREILSVQPENAHALHLLGVIALQKGRAEDACKRIEAAIERDDGHALFHCNLGEAHRLLGRMDEAEKCFLAAIERQPDYPQALTNLGITLHQRGRHADAQTRFRQVLEMAGPSADGYSNLGLAQFAGGDIDDAISTLRRAIELDPHHVEANNNLGAALLEKGNFEAAAFVLEEAVRANPRAADAWTNLARARLGQLELKAAEQCARRAIELDPDQARFHLVLGLVLSEARRPGEAEAALKEAVQLTPGQATPHYALGTVLMRVGRFDEAEAALRQAIALNTGMTAAYEALSSIHIFGTEDLPAIEHLEQLAGSLENDPPARIHLEFALAKMLDDCKEFDRAFAHLQTANALKREQIEFDAAALWRILEDMRRTLDRNRIEQLATMGSDSEIPILIVGMPRSGTTLVEQILASHPEVAGAGEVGYLETAARNLARESEASYPACLSGLTGAVAGHLVEGYLTRLEQERDGARFVTDKRPHDFVHLGLFSILFPKARIVHCVRDPVDVCFSIYRQHFERENVFAYRLDDIAAYHQFYRLMMAHWESVLPTPIFDLCYEELVNDQERITRELLDFCGLPWDGRCLRPHETQREIRSASYWQARQPVFTDSVGKWRRYERHLGPLVKALSQSGYGASES